MLLALEHKTILMRLHSVFYLESLVYFSLNLCCHVIWYVFCSFTWLIVIVMQSRTECTASSISVAVDFHLEGRKSNNLAFQHLQVSLSWALMWNHLRGIYSNTIFLKCHFHDILTVFTHYVLKYSVLADMGKASGKEWIYVYVELNLCAMHLKVTAL